MEPINLKVEQKVQLKIVSNGEASTSEVLVDGKALAVTDIHFEIGVNGDTELGIVTLRTLRPSLELEGQFDVIDIILKSSAIDNHRKRNLHD